MEFAAVEHIAVTPGEPNWRGKRKLVELARCGIAHGEEVAHMDCPVASRWTLVRAS